MSRPFSIFKVASGCASRTRRRCLGYPKNSHLFGGHREAVLAPRRYAATAAVRRPPPHRTEFLDDEEFDMNRTQSRPGSSSRNREDQPEFVPYPKLRPMANPEPLVAHLLHLFPPLEFPETVASQMMTHISAKEAWAGHNARLAFVGRRVLHSYLLLFLHSAAQQLARTTPSLNPNTAFDFDLIAYRALHTPLLGEYVGTPWDLARTMLWTAPVRSVSSRHAASGTPLSRQFQEEGRSVHETPGSLRSPGLYKVQGTTVEGIVGGVFHQFGGTIAQRVFHTRLLPHILCPGTPFGLHDAFHNAALDLSARMGGPDGLLISKAEARKIASSTLLGNRKTGLGRPRSEQESANLGTS